MRDLGIEATYTRRIRIDQMERGDLIRLVVEGTEVIGRVRYVGDDGRPQIEDTFGNRFFLTEKAKATLIED